MTERTLSELAEICGATLVGDGSLTVVGPASLEEARPDQIAFLGHPKYERLLAETRAAAVLVGNEVESTREGLALLRCDDPSRAFSEVVRLFAAAPPAPPPGVHPTAVVDPSVELGADVSVGPLCVLGEGSRIGDRSVLHAGVCLGDGVTVGEDCEIHPGVVMYAGVTLGSRCVVHAGSVLGSEGFGFDPCPDGWTKVPQCGSVVLEDDVEVGANCTIDRGRFGATRIGRCAKLDNQVHVAHNVVVGEMSLLVAQVGIAGSSRLGKRVVVAGQAGISGHVQVGDGARIGGGSAVYSDVEGGRDYLGIPVAPRVEALRAMATARRLPELAKTVRELEERLERLESESGGASE